MSETPWKLCELCGVEPVDHGRVCETCKSLPDAVAEMLTKRCNRCGEFKELDQFDNDKHSRDGKTGTCKQCRKLRDLERYHAKKAKKAFGITSLQPPEKSVIHKLAGDESSYIDQLDPISKDELYQAFEHINEQARRFMPPDQLPERNYIVTVDFSDCPWLLAYLEGESLPVSLQIKRRIIETMSDGELRSWLLTGMVA